MLRALERGNLFLRPLDDRRQWYRYHQLFADVLHARLVDEYPDEVEELHHLASTWFENEGDPAEAFRHSVAAHELERAAELAESAQAPMLRARRESEVRGWLRQLPEEIVRSRPVLNIGFVGALMSVNEFDGVAERLRDV